MTISARRLTIFERAAMNIDREAVEATRRSEAKRRTAERVAQLRHIVMRNAGHNRDIEDLKNEADAARLLICASNNADGFAVLGILRVAIDERWRDVVQAGIRHFDEHPVAAHIQELWNLTADRPAV
ncbi:hypothetical protein [Mycolicibacter hiberniae]|uniref:hypothetical protein n=1 Tax=Mycolicibacter hiberniae TaxID=29314 RepID=UPI0010544EFE|nr:hypothetical protein [Mycolicibacter hiberniae]MCV7087365.1 hypothetical protein [Mycolicibacter hiberniae]